MFCKLLALNRSDFQFCDILILLKAGKTESFVLDFVHMGRRKVIADFIHFSSQKLYVSFMNKNRAMLFK